MSHPSQSGLPEPDITVVLAADARFALPLAVAVQSLIDNLGPGRRLRLFLIDGGLSEESRRRMARAWGSESVEVQWIDFDGSRLGGLTVSEHVTCLTYSRLFLPDLLPQTVERVLYLDCDLIVEKDIGRLWDTPLGNRLCLAVQDVAAPYVDLLRAIPAASVLAPYVAATTPIRNYRDLKIPPDAKYFNGGVLSIDLAGWRDGGLTAKFLDCLQEHAQHVLWWDQYALNVVLADAWGELDMSWNVQSQLFEQPVVSQSLFGEETCRQARANPGIVHFNTPRKPWQFGNRHPLRDRFFHYLDRTCRAGWRPRPTSADVRRWSWDAYLALRSLIGHCLRRLRGR